jgi:glycosyltransferase involved in cell wall biosynthesis
MSVLRPSGLPPRVAVVVISDLEFGGAQRQVIELANHIDPARYDLHVVALHDYTPLAGSLREADRRLHIIPRRGKFDFTVVTRLHALLKKLGASVVHGYLFDAEIAARLAGRLAGAAVIGSERNTDYVLRRVNLLAYRLTRRCHDFTIANSRAGAEFNARLLRQPPEQYRVVYNGVDVNRFQPRDGSALRAELGLLPEHRVVGIMASFKPQKNHLMFIEAAARVLRQVPQARFLFVGDELFQGSCDSVQQKQKMLALVEKLGLKPYCLFVGNRPDVERYYHACEVTALSSLFEGTPNAALESMASGVPVVATDVSDHRHVIPSGRVGHIVPLDDVEGFAQHLSQLLIDEEARRVMAQRARAWVMEEFSCARLGQRTADVYDEAVARRSRSSPSWRDELCESPYPQKFKNS